MGHRPITYNGVSSMDVEIHIFHRNLLIFQPDDVVQIACQKINALMESFMGIHDDELGKQRFYFPVNDTIWNVLSLKM